MGTTLVNHISHLIPDFSQNKIISDGAIFIRDNVIEAIGTSSNFVQDAETQINGAGLIILPGLVNTHHHLYQTLTRAVPAAQNVSLFNWLKTLYPIWAKMDAEAVYVARECHKAIIDGCGYARCVVRLYRLN